VKAHYNYNDNGANRYYTEESVPNMKPFLGYNGNIDLSKRRVVHNPDGSISTVKSIGIQKSENNPQQTIIPTVVNGAIVGPRVANINYRRTGEFLGTRPSMESAGKYSENLSKYMGKNYNPEER